MVSAYPDRKNQGGYIVMELNGINSNTYTQAANYSQTASKVSDRVDDKSKDTEEAAAVYEKTSEKSTSGYTGANKKVDAATIEKLKADAEARYEQLASLVEKLITKQGETNKVATLSDIMKDVVSGKIEVEPEIVEQAKKDVADDGYWGVDQTAERIVSFAKALTGGDSSKIEEMRKAVEKGFNAAGKEWGDELPEISKKTYDKVNELFDEWAKESNEN